MSKGPLAWLWLCLSIAVLSSPAAAQISPRLVRGPYLQTGTPTSIVVRWRTDVPTDSRVRFGLASDSLDRQVDDSQPAVDHQVTLTGLAPATRYYYSIGSTAQTLAGADADHYFVTAPPPGTRQPVRIWAFGDAGDHPQNLPQREVRDAYLGFANGRRTDVWLLLGDNAYTLANDADYQTDLFESYPTILRQTVVWPTFGNHEAFSANAETQLGAYFDIFTLPTAGQAGGVRSGTEAYYSFDHANIHFISLNTEVIDRGTTGPMLTWLRQDLAANAQDWTIVYFHRPVYSKGGHDSDRPNDSLDQSTAMRDMRERALPILEEHGVDLVLTGHSHSYERSYLLDGHYGTSSTLTAAMKVDDGDGDPNGDGPYVKPDDVSADGHAGAVYAVVGTGEENDGGTLDHPAMVTSIGDRTGTLVIDVDGLRLDAVFVDVNGNPTDPFTIIKGAANLPPNAMDDRAVVETGASVTVAVLANDRDRNRDGLTLASVGAPERGTARGNADGTVTYVPAPDFVGTDSFTYTVSDGRGGTDTANVVVTVVCPAEVLFEDDFEPAAEPGWTVETAVNESPLSAPWTLVSDPAAHSPQRAWSSQAGAETLHKDDRLISPPQRLTPSSRLTFWHLLDFEERFDGGVLEISEDGGATWIDLGPSIRGNGYNGTTVSSNSIGSRPAWTGASPGMVPVEVDLGGFAGEGRLIRWRLGCDEFTPESHAGWLVDDVEVTTSRPGCGPPADSCGEPIFVDGFESGDLSRWSASETDGGDLAARGAAAIEGAFGLEAVLDDHSSLAVRDETPAAEPSYCARFLLDPNSVALRDEKRLSLLRAYDGAGNRALEVFLRNGAVPGTYALRVDARQDDGTTALTGWLPVGDAAARVSLGWRRASGPEASDGSVTVFLDGMPAAELTGIDNDASTGIEAVELGAMSPKRGTSGAVRFDSFESGRSGPGGE